MKIRSLGKKLFGFRKKDETIFEKFELKDVSLDTVRKVLKKKQYKLQDDWGIKDQGEFWMFFPKHDHFYIGITLLEYNGTIHVDGLLTTTNPGDEDIEYELHAELQDIKQQVLKLVGKTETKKEDNNQLPNKTESALTTSFKFCPECGTKLAPGSKFCQNCGRKLN